MKLTKAQMTKLEREWTQPFGIHAVAEALADVADYTAEVCEAGEDQKLADSYGEFAHCVRQATEQLKHALDLSHQSREYDKQATQTKISKLGEDFVNDFAK